MLAVKSFIVLQYLRQIEFNYKINFSDLIKSICYDSNIKCFYLILEIGEGVILLITVKNNNVIKKACKKIKMPKKLSPNHCFASVTLNDVAKLANVSPMTVSRVLNQPEIVSKNTAKKVNRAISITGYVPNLLAGGLASRRTKLIAVIIPAITSPVYAETVKIFIDLLRKSGYQVLLGEAGFTIEKEERLLFSILSRRPDAVILTGAVHSIESQRRLMNAKIPIVEIWELTFTPLDIVVGFSHEKVGEKVAKYLVKKGYKHIGIISADDRRAQIRKNAFKNTLEQCGITDITFNTVSSPPNLQSGRNGAKELIKSGLHTDAIFCSSDTIAQGVLIETTKKKLSIPEDIAIMGFGDQSFSEYTFPSLSTVRIDRVKMGKRATEAIIGRIEGKSGTEKIIDIGFEIIERGTT